MRITLLVSIALISSQVALAQDLKVEEEAILAKLDSAQRGLAQHLLKEDGSLPKLSANSHEDLRTGEVGELLRNSFEYDYGVNQVIDEKNMLIFGSSIWIEGLSTKDIVDDATISLKGIVLEVKGTKRYTSVLGASRTVKHLAVMDASAAVAAAQKVRELRLTRTWKDSSGTYTVRALFVKYDKGKVVLRKDDGAEVSLQLNQLGKDDQAWVRDEIKRSRELDEKRNGTAKKSKR